MSSRTIYATKIKLRNKSILDGFCNWMLRIKSTRIRYVIIEARTKKHQFQSVGGTMFANGKKIGRKMRIISSTIWIVVRKLVLLICFNPRVKKVRSTDAAIPPMIDSTENFSSSPSAKRFFRVMRKVPTRISSKNSSSFQFIVNL